MCRSCSGPPVRNIAELAANGLSCKGFMLLLAGGEDQDRSSVDRHLLPTGGAAARRRRRVVVRNLPPTPHPLPFTPHPFGCPSRQAVTITLSSELKKIRLLGDIKFCRDRLLLYTGGSPQNLGQLSCTDGVLAMLQLFQKAQGGGLGSFYQPAAPVMAPQAFSVHPRHFR